MKKNPSIGKNTEILFCNSIGDQPSVIKYIKEEFNITGSYLNSILTGHEGEKCDVRISFVNNIDIDVTIKSYKDNTMFNQATRSNLDNFMQAVGLPKMFILDLRKEFLRKASDSKAFLISSTKQNLWRERLQPYAKKIVKWSLSRNTSREILALYDRTNKLMQLYKMSYILSKLNYDIGFTPKGNIKIGSCITLQRKGGDGNIKTYQKIDPKHPSNHVQIKLNIKNFLYYFKPFVSYTI